MKIGILGGGQLGRMMAVAGYPLGLTFRVLEPALESPAAQVVAERIQGDFEDNAVLDRFVDGLDLVTFEFENVPFASANRLAQRAPVLPPPAALAAAQDRVVEKRFFASLGVPVPTFASVETRAEFDDAVRDIGLPAVLKTTRLGYDGKGQRVLRDRHDIEPAWDLLGQGPLILETLIPFDRELSLIAVRALDGATAFYPLVENLHRAGMLRRSIAPAPGLTPRLQQTAEDFATRALVALKYVGVLAIEFFEKDGGLLVNEMAPRVHNSGHWTIEGAQTSQFENHLRAVAGLPLGATQAIGSSVMLNLIGSAPPLDDMLRLPGAHVHLYGKTPRASRKLGHVTLRGESTEAMAELVGRLAAMIGDAECE
jgi:5-(carboxyamino)imidazole ribonucleotide synthase